MQFRLLWVWRLGPEVRSFKIILFMREMVTFGPEIVLMPEIE